MTPSACGGLLAFKRNGRRSVDMARSTRLKRMLEQIDKVLAEEGDATVDPAGGLQLEMATLRSVFLLSPSFMGSPMLWIESEEPSDNLTI